MQRGDDLAIFYETRSESDRLTRGIAQLEAARTLELLGRYLPPSPSVICDIGGATGYYARRLTEQGYTVHLLDPIASHIESARQNCPLLASAQVGDARNLPWPDQSADAVLLMGPLYHLTARADRVHALTEARRVLRPTGILFGVVIPRWASTLIGMLRGWIFDNAYAHMVRREITTGHHARPDTWPDLFVDGYFHSTGDLHAEAADAGLTIRHCLAIEGPITCLTNDFDAAWQEPAKREQILELARLAEHDAEILAASPHVAFVAAP